MKPFKSNCRIIFNFIITDIQGRKIKYLGGSHRVSQSFFPPLIEVRVASHGWSPLQELEIGKNKLPSYFYFFKGVERIFSGYPAIYEKSIENLVIFCDLRPQCMKIVIKFKRRTIPWWVWCIQRNILVNLCRLFVPVW